MKWPSLTTIKQKKYEKKFGRIISRKLKREIMIYKNYKRKETFPDSLKKMLCKQIPDIGIPSSAERVKYSSTETKIHVQAKLPQPLYAFIIVTHL
jgi:hypothetical protein